MDEPKPRVCGEGLEVLKAYARQIEGREYGFRQTDRDLGPPSKLAFGSLVFKDEEGKGLIPVEFEQICVFSSSTPDEEVHLRASAHALLFDLLDSQKALQEACEALDALKHETQPLRPVWPILPEGTGFCVEHGVVWPEFERFCPECGVPVLGAAVEKLRERSRSVSPEGALPLVDGPPTALPPSRPRPPWWSPVMEPEPIPNAPWTPSPPFADSRSCGKCGLKLEPVMGYVCQNHPCPVGLGGPFCGVGRG